MVSSGAQVKKKTDLDKWQQIYNETKGVKMKHFFSDYN